MATSASLVYVLMGMAEDILRSLFLFIDLTAWENDLPSMYYYMYTLYTIYT